MNLTHFSESNYLQFFKDNPEQINLKYQISHWVEKKKRVMPDWHQYAYDEEGNIFYRFLLSEEKPWYSVVFDEELCKSNHCHDGFNQ